LAKFCTAVGEEVLETDNTSHSRSLFERLSRTSAPQNVPFSDNELFAGSLGSSNDFVEVIVTAQIIPARSEAQMAVSRAVCDRRSSLWLLT
jgi:hypothetical protein